MVSSESFGMTRKRGMDRETKRESDQIELTQTKRATASPPNQWPSEPKTTGMHTRLTVYGALGYGRATPT